MKIKLLKLLKTFSIACFCSISSFAQTPMYTFTNGTGGNAIPLGSGTTWSNYRSQFLYLPGDFAPAINTTAVITKIYFKVSSGSTATTYSDFKVSIGNTTQTATNTTFITTGLTQALNASTKSFPGMSSGQWMEIELTTPVTVDFSMPIVVDVSQTGKVGNTGGYSLMASGVPVNPVYTGHTQTYSSGATSTTGSSRRYSYQFGVDVITCSTAITKQPEDKTVCETKGTQFDVVVDDAGDYQWQSDEGAGFVDITDNALYTGATTPSLKLTNIPFSLNGTKYRCLASKSSCADTSDEVTLTVNGLVKLTDMKAKDTTCISATKDLMVKGNGSITNYRWQIYINGHGYVDVPMQAPFSQSSNVLHITGVPDTLDGSRFRCIVDGVCDTATSNEVRLTVALIPYVAIPPTDVIAKHGENVQFEVQATAPGARYFWQVAATNDTFVYINDGGIYSGARTNRLTVKGVSKIQSDFKFRCIVASSIGCNAPGDTSNFAVLTVSPPAGIAGVNNDNIVVLYPNPVNSSELYVKVSGVLASEVLSYRVVDKIGRTVKSGILEKGTNDSSINVSQLAADVYLLELRNERGELQSTNRFTKM